MRTFIAGLILSLAAIPTAQAGPVLSLPEVSLGESAMRSFHGELNTGESMSLIDVPTGQEFIITAFHSESTVFQLVQDDVVVLDRYQTGLDYIRKGISRITIPGGSTLSILFSTGDTEARRFLLQGYLAQAGGPYRYAAGETSSTSPVTIFHNDTDRLFVVQSVVNSSFSCPIYIDGELVIPGRFFRTYETPDSGENEAFLNRRGGLVLPARSTLQIAANYTHTSCKYLMEGEYITP